MSRASRILKAQDKAIPSLIATATAKELKAPMTEPRMARIPHTDGLVFIEERQVSGPMLEAHDIIGIINVRTDTKVVMSSAEWASLAACADYIRSQAKVQDVGDMIAAQIRRENGGTR